MSPIFALRSSRAIKNIYHTFKVISYTFKELTAVRIIEIPKDGTL